MYTAKYSKNDVNSGKIVKEMNWNTSEERGGFACYDHFFLLYWMEWEVNEENEQTSFST